MAYLAGLIRAELVPDILKMLLALPYVAINARYSLGKKKKASQPVKSVSASISAVFAENRRPSLSWVLYVVIPVGVQSQEDLS